MPPRELPTRTTCFAPVAASTLSISEASKSMCSVLDVRPSWAFASSSRAVGYGTSIACRRARGQPFDSNRHSVVIQSPAVSPLPCTKTIGGRSEVAGERIAQAASSAAPSAVQNSEQAAGQIERHRTPPSRAILRGRRPPAVRQAVTADAARGEHAAQHRLGQHLGGERADQRDVRRSGAGAGREREDDVAVGHRVGRVDAARQAVLRHLRDLVGLGLGQSRVGRDDTERGRAAGRRRPGQLAARGSPASSRAGHRRRSCGRRRRPRRWPGRRCRRAH